MTINCIMWGSASFAQCKNALWLRLLPFDTV
jgi:hypothetical protein